ncbi:hypothetical protein BDA96_03G059200 [Sorghum bicolor]|uniref:Uncharacterized protein n=2 Tax=Sorghum bicolor TaxID=4558 RepID=A0A921RCB4_SORBI|nr:uncharacterized protein LOC8078500 isoform X2 [Sorghum bicolor]EES02399.1 hypothetical protein SORBI_3003G055400 [Sorghum bicolor]KAG0536385.1 hypothetical protein BDA96_03G059200 [Sorghum bicolor]|eukprot:XP_002457279.1 uncharacterized protein LOC8078500 isoform X2 [Sorghum bicolor]
MASPSPGPPAWSVTLSLRHRGGLEIRAAAENLLPGWGRGGERLSLLLRLRRRLLLSVTSQCGDRPAAATQPGTPPRGSRVVRFLRSRWGRLPRVTSIWGRKKQPAARVAAAVPRDRKDQRSRTPTRPGFWAMAWTPESAATLRFVVVVVFAALALAVAIVAAFRITGGLSNRREGCDSKPIARWAKFLELIEHPPLNCNYKCLLGVPKRGLEWIFSK